MATTDALSKTPTAKDAVVQPYNSANWKTASEAEKLEAGFQWVEIPSKDPYDYVFKGIWLNGTGAEPDFKPGKHLVHPDVAAALNERLARFAQYNVRLMRPQADLTSLSQVPGNN